MIDGVSWIHGLGYQPHVASWEDPLELRRRMDSLGIQFSQVEAAFPLSRPEGATLGVEYILITLRWARIAGFARAACRLSMLETSCRLLVTRWLPS